MNKIISVLALFTLCMVINILVMINGWGLEPKSWWWIIGGTYFARTVVEIMSTVAKEDK